MIAVRRAPVAAMLAIALAIAGVARAQGTPADRDTDSERERTALFREGIELAGAGHWCPEARDRFRRVVDIRSAPRALFTLGQAEEQCGSLATARALFVRALADARAAGDRDVTREAERAIEEVMPRVPRVRLVAKTDPDAREPTATIDGQPAPFDQDVFVDPGTHRVEAHAVGARPLSRTVTVGAGESVQVDIALEREAARPRTPPSPTTGGSRFPLGPALLGGAGAVASIAGLIVYLGARSDYDSARQTCDDTQGGAQCPASAVDAADTARTKMIVGDVLLGAGVAAVGGAVLWWVLGGGSKAQARVGVVPVAGGASVAAGARF